MKLHIACTGKITALALAFLLAGCTDFSQHRFGGVRHGDVRGKPTPDIALAIPNPPVVADKARDAEVKTASFVPAAEPVQQVPDHPLRKLYQRATHTHSGMDSYIFRMKRREVVNGGKQPEEVMLVKVRREPFSVYMKWLSDSGKGREVIYVQGKYKNEMQVLTAAGDIPFFPGGSRMAFALDSSLVKGKSRYPITSTGLGSLIERYGKMVQGIEKGDEREGTAKYLGKLKRPEFEAEVEAVQQTLPPNGDPGLPKGGQRWWFFDATSALPVLIIANDGNGEVEYYCHDHIQWPVRLDDDDFNPDRLWRK